MKRNLALTIAFAVLFLSANTQPLLPGKFDGELYGKVLQAKDVSLEADKNLAELSEIVNVHVRIAVITSKVEGSYRFPYRFDYAFKNPAEAPWKIGEYKILSGGATVMMMDGNLAQIKMPAKMPTDKSVTIQVTLEPYIKEFPQVQLFTTIYLADNKNVFYFNCPGLGINNEKYVVDYNGGAFTKTDSIVKNTSINPKVKGNAKVQAKTKEYYMKQVAAEISATQNGLDLAAATSNAKAFYSADNNVTGITINGDKVTMINGRKTANKRMYVITISFPGSSTGSFTLKSKKENNIGISLPMQHAGFGCGDDPEEAARRDAAGEPGPSCSGGTIVITKYDKKEKIVEGYFYAGLEGGDGYSTQIHGTLHGKFSVTLAN